MDVGEYCLELLIWLLNSYRWERSGSVVECLTRDRGVARSSLTRITALCHWARHIYPCIVLVQPRKNSPYITEKLLTGTLRIKSNKRTKLAIGSPVAYFRILLVTVAKILISEKMSNCSCSVMYQWFDHMSPSRLQWFHSIFPTWTPRTALTFPHH